jgi:hypothetical protein
MAFIDSDLSNRMIFAHQIAALETYLGDEFIKETMAPDENLTKLLSTAQACE